MSPLNLRREIRLLGDGVCKDPTLFGWDSLLAPLRDQFSQRRMQRNIVLGVFGFDIIHVPVHDAALNEKLILFKIEVVPLKRRDLAHAKTETLGDIGHRAIRLFQ